MIHSMDDSMAGERMRSHAYELCLPGGVTCSQFWLMKLVPE